MHRSVLHCTGMCCIAHVCAALHRSVLHCTGLCCIAQVCAALHRSVLHCTGMCCRTQVCAALHRSVLHYTGLCCITQVCAAGHRSVLQDTGQCCITQVSSALHRYVLHYTGMCCITQVCAALHRSVLHYTGLCCITQVCAALHRSVLHYTGLSFGTGWDSVGEEVNITQYVEIHSTIDSLIIYLLYDRLSMSNNISWFQTGERNTQISWFTLDLFFFSKYTNGQIWTDKQTSQPNGDIYTKHMVNSQRKQPFIGPAVKRCTKYGISTPFLSQIY